MGLFSRPQNNTSSLQLAAAENTDHVQAGPLAGVQDPFWQNLSGRIDATRWNKTFPYQLLVVTRDDGGGWSETAAKFTLPIPPESIQISTPFAITTSVTLGGIVEEHNGAPIRMIQFSGTTGVLPLRGEGGQAGTTNLAQSIFAGTVASANRLVGRVANLLNPGGGGISTNLLDDQEVTAESVIGRGSGYFQFRLLQSFLESYVALKKTALGRQFRLAFAMWKDEAVYLVTPQNLQLSRTANDPLSYNYNISLKAWRRIKLTGAGDAPTTLPFGPTARDANTLAQIISSIDNARSVLQGVKDTIGALAGDVDRTVFEPLRQTALFCKDAIGIATTMADLPNNILRNLKGPLLEWSSVVGSFNGGLKAQLNASGSERSRLADQLSKIASDFGKAETGSGDPNGFNGQQKILNLQPTFRILEDPNANYSVLSKVRMGELNLPASLRQNIQDEHDRNATLTRLDFENMRNALQATALDLGDALGLGDDVLDATYGRTRRPTTKAATPKDFDALFALNDSIQQLNRLAATGRNDRQNLSGLDLIAAQAAVSGFPFQRPQSKFAVPFPYGATLEALALQYLGSPDRALEIAALNGLRAPFVDEIGFSRTLLGNGAGNTVVVQDAQNLYVSQLITLVSNNTAKSQRHIMGIERIGDTEFLIQLDGDPDLSRFTTAAAAALLAFLPGTVNSQRVIFIPSNQPSSDEDFQGKDIPGVNEFDAMVRVGGVDLLLTPKNDLIFTPDGDQPLAIGLANIVQEARIRVAIPRGRLLHHPGIGLGVRAGQSTADLDVHDLIMAARDLYADDPVFINVASANATKDGPAAMLNLGIVVAGVTQPIPVTIRVQPQP